MENIFFEPLAQRDYRQKALQLVRAFLAEKDAPTQERFATMLLHSGEGEAHKAYLEAFLKGEIPKNPSKNVYTHIVKIALKFVEVQESLRLLQCEIWEGFDGQINEARQQLNDKRNWIDLAFSSSHHRKIVIEKDAEFEFFFRHYVQLVQTLYTDKLPMYFEKYNVSEANLHEVIAVERYCLLAMLQDLYEAYRQDIHTILAGLQNAYGGLEFIKYKIPYFNLDFLVASLPHGRGDGNHLKINIRAEQRIQIANPLPTPTGTHKRFLELRLNEVREQNLAYQAQTSTQLVVAQHDLQTVAQTFARSNKLTQNISLRFESRLRVGEMQTRLETSIFWKHSFLGQSAVVASMLGALGAFFLIAKGFIWLLPVGIICAVLFLWIMWKGYS